MKKIIDREVGVNLKNFPSTRYQGSKRKILPWIYRYTKDLKFNTVLDGFGGSASVSYLFKKMNKEVTYNDKLYFNYIIGKALIQNSRVRIENNDLDWVINKQPDVEYRDTIERNFKNIYYLDEENKWLDTVIANINNFKGYSRAILDHKKSLLYYALFQSCIIKRPFNLFHRNNLNLRINDVERNFGNKTTWEKPFEHYIQQFTNEINDLVFFNKKKCTSINESVFDIDPYGYDLVYLDPPYFSKKDYHESSDYLHCYHFLEGIANYNNWEEFIDPNTKNKRLNRDFFENDFKISEIRESFENLFEKFRDSTIVLSYKKGGEPSIDFITKLLKKFKKRVKTHSLHYKYALNHQNGDAKNNREVLIIGI